MAVNDSGIELPVRVTGEAAVNSALSSITDRLNKLEAATKSASSAQTSAQRPAQNLTQSFTKLNGTVSLLAQTSRLQAVGALNNVTASLVGLESALGPVGIAFTGLTLIIGNAISRLDAARKKFDEVTEAAKRLRDVSVSQILGQMQQQDEDQTLNDRLAMGDGSSMEFRALAKKRFDQLRALQTEIEGARTLRRAGGIPVAPGDLGTERDPSSPLYRQSEVQEALRQMTEARQQHARALEFENAQREESNALAFYGGQGIPRIEGEAQAIERQASSVRNLVTAKEALLESERKLELFRTRGQRFTTEQNTLMLDAGGGGDFGSFLTGVQENPQNRSVEEIVQQATEAEFYRDVVKQIGDAWRDASDWIVDAGRKLDENNKKAEESRKLYLALGQAGVSVYGDVANAIAAAEKTEKAKRIAIATTAGLQAVFETAAGFAALATPGMQPSAVLHFASAAKYGIAAIMGGAGVGAGFEGGSGGVGNEPRSTPIRDRRDTSNSGSGNSYVINFGSPVVTAATLSELGVQIQRATEAASSRYGER